MPTLDCISVGVLPWEQVLETIDRSPEGDAFQQFYAQCLRFNPGPGKSAG